jgi:hypothetical protein
MQQSTLPRISPQRSRCRSVHAPHLCRPGRARAAYDFGPNEGSVFGSERLTGALLDRLTHHVHILEMNGESFRLKHSRSGRTKSPD